MKRMIMICILTLAILSAGCTENDTTDISDDAVITHLTYGAFTLQSMAVQELVINSTTVNLSYYNYENKLTARYIKPIDEETRSNLLELFRDNQFTKMDKLYEPQEGQPIVADTGTVEISLDQDGTTKTVKVDPYFHDYMPDKLREIDEALLKLKRYAAAISTEDAEAMAGEWIMNAPTYSFDGSNPVLTDHQYNEEEPEVHILTYTFNSSHGGYGNRSDQMVTQVITNHIVEIRLYNEIVESVIIDDMWNEMTQSMLDKVVEMKSEQACDQTPWQLWYAEGNINFLMEPTEEELVIAYFSTFHGIEISDFSSRSLNDGMCQYSLKIKESDAETMAEFGWQEA
ncbi:hypothetical protein RE476_03450 [Methanolobus mangrovi]|uniref:Uncharacterized protein n=1 Tax=Methanolobus mangrovi TaxID=3072977 RepID=A0AA51YJS1_9EURY|nr:hypothetical protein [Methanolobus mangrovi]WMW22893.1 hypothetical protein RE476_03450 [Methanolobus mangrovi]